MHVRAVCVDADVEVVELVGVGSSVDTSALLDALLALCSGGGDVVIDAQSVDPITSPVFGVMQALAVRLARAGARVVAVCAPGELPRLRGMRVGRDFEVAGSVDGARWMLERPPSRFVQRH